MNSIIRETLNICLRRKLLSKLNNMISEITRGSQVTPFSTIIHGHFVRSKLMFRYTNNKPCEVKIVGWHTVTYDSVAMDFCRIVLSNLPDNTNVNQLVAFFCRILMAYLENAQIYSENRMRLQTEIISRLMYSYADFFWTLENHGKLIQMFHNLGALD